jgi:hypothetical protein
MPGLMNPFAPPPPLLAKRSPISPELLAFAAQMQQQQQQQQLLAQQAFAQPRIVPVPVPVPVAAKPKPKAGSPRRTQPQPWPAVSDPFTAPMSLSTRTAPVPREMAAQPQGARVLQPGQSARAPSRTGLGPTGGRLNKTIVDGLLRRGFPQHVAMGVAAGIQAESADNPRARNPTSGAMGFGQWLGPRQAELINRFGDNPSVEQQLDFMAYELRGGDHGGKSVLAAKTPQDVLRNYIINFMRPAKGAETTGDLNRGMAALGYLDQAQLALGVPNANDLQNGFDPSLYNGALNQVDIWQRQMSTPTSTTVDRAPMPEMPDAPDLPSRDFSTQDAIMASLAPQAFDPEGKEAKGLQRRRLLQGMAQGLAGLDEDAGVGQILAQVGAGMLGGRLAADDEIQEKIDLYDRKLEAYKQAQFSYEGQKSEAKFQEVTNEAQLAYDLSLKKWGTAMTDWQQNNSSSFENGMIVTKSVTPDGDIKIVTNPLKPYIAAQAAQQRMQIQSSMAGMANQENVSQAAILNSAVVSTATGMMSMDMQNQMAEGDPVAAANTAAAMYAATAIDSGLVQQLVPAEAYADALKAANDYAAGLGLGQGTKEFAEAVKESLTGNLTVEIQNNPELRARFEAMGPALTGLARNNDRRTRRTRAGNTTTTTTEVP